MFDTFILAPALVQAAACILGVLVITYGIAIGTKSQKVYAASVGGSASVALILVIYMAMRWVELGRPPYKTLAETLVFLTLNLTAVGLGFGLTSRIRVMPAIAALAAFIAVLIGFRYWDIHTADLPPSLQSGWFIPHVLIYLIGYATMLVSWLFAVAYFVWPGRYELKAESRSAFLLGTPVMDLENFVYRTTVFGFVCLSIGLCLGGIWAKYAWGDHWFWDPKENWALISWLVYLAYLHTRVVAGWRGRKSALFAVIGGLAVLFTYLGMNYLPSAVQSVHVYQG